MRIKKTLMILSTMALTGILVSGKNENSLVEQQNNSRSTVYHVIFHSPGPRWVDSLGFREQPGIMEHINYMAGILKTKKLVEGGPFLDDSGGMMVYDGTKEEAEKVANADPAVKVGLLKFKVRPWLVAMSRK